MSATCSATPGHARRSDRSRGGRRRHALRRLRRRRAGRLRALLPLAPDAGHRARRLLRRLSRSQPGPVVSRHRHGHGHRAARIPRDLARPGRLRHGRLDAVRERRRRLGEHALLAHRPHHRQRGCQSQLHPPGLRAGRRRRLPARRALVGPRRISLRQSRLDRLPLRLRPGALRFAVRPASVPGRPELQVRRGRREGGQGEGIAAPAAGKSTARPPSSSRAIRRSPRPTTGRKACRPAARAARPGRCRPISACACGRAASSTTTPSFCRASALPRRRARRASPTARRSAPFPTRATARRACSCARHSGWAASARRSRATSTSCSASATSRG